jgi:hypothetical protein
MVVSRCKQAIEALGSQIKIFHLMLKLCNVLERGYLLAYKVV